MQAVRPRLDGGLSVRNAQGVRISAQLLRAHRGAIVFEVYGPGLIARSGETLEDVTLVRTPGPRMFGGPAQVSEVLSTGVSQIITAVPRSEWLQEAEAGGAPAALTGDIDALLREWDADQQLPAEFRAAVSDLRSFLARLCRWAAPIDLALGARPADAPGWSGNLAEGVYAHVGPRLRALFDAFEDAAAPVPPELLDVRRAYAQQELHPLLLCSPLLHRSVTRPLGYSGDYEMVNMILRNGMEGDGVYARVVNAHMLRTGIAQGHRNRVAKLTDILHEEARRTAARGRPLRVLNVGCGPADEVVRFIGRDPLADRCEFSLVDFNAETIAYTDGQIAEAVRRSGRRPTVELIRRSVNDLLKEASRGVATPVDGRQYDLVYCAGLFDYLSDKVCARLLEFFLGRVADGGRVVATNVHPRHGDRATMDDLADWRLILRDEGRMAALAPAGATDVTAACEPSGANVFLDFRRVAGTDDCDRVPSRLHTLAGRLPDV